jgi:hypothetical protein
VHKSKSTLSDGDYDGNTNQNSPNFQEKSELGNEIRVLIDNIKSVRDENIQKILDDPKIKKAISEMFNDKPVKSSKKEEYEGTAEVNAVINVLNTNKLTENELFLCIIKLLSTFTMKSSLMDYFLKQYGIVSYLSILNGSVINSRIVYIMLYTLNKMIQNNSATMEDMICYQLFFHMSKFLQIFPEIDIKIEIILMIFLILMNNQTILKLFLSSGGFIIIPSLIDPNYDKSHEIVLILALDFMLYILDKLDHKSEDI